MGRIIKYLRPKDWKDPSWERWTSPKQIATRLLWFHLSFLERLLRRNYAYRIRIVGAALDFHGELALCWKPASLCHPRVGGFYEGQGRAGWSPSALQTLSLGLRNAFWSMLIQLLSLYWQFRPAFRDILEQMMFSWYLKKKISAIFCTFGIKVETELEAH